MPPECLLATDSRGNATEQSRHLGARLCKAENIIDEKKYVSILLILITEILGDSEPSQSDAGTSTRRLIHLNENRSNIRVALPVDDTGLDHFMAHVVTLTSALTDPWEKQPQLDLHLRERIPTENRETTARSFRSVVDKFLDQDGFPDTSTIDETNISTAGVGSPEVDDLDTNLENLRSHLPVYERRGGQREWACR
jgi:hypothetical protein